MFEGKTKDAIKNEIDWIFMQLRGRFFSCSPVSSRPAELKKGDCALHSPGTLVFSLRRCRNAPARKWRNLQRLDEPTVTLVSTFNRSVGLLCVVFKFHHVELFCSIILSVAVLFSEKQRV